MSFVICHLSSINNIRVQTEQQKEMLPGGQRLLYEYFQSGDRKHRYDKAKDAWAHVQ